MLHIKIFSHPIDKQDLSKQKKQFISTFDFLTLDNDLWHSIQEILYTASTYKWMQNNVLIKFEIEYSFNNKLEKYKIPIEDLIIYPRSQQQTIKDLLLKRKTTTYAQLSLNYFTARLIKLNYT